MTWTYTNNPANSNRDLVRDLINDTDATSEKVSDEFIAYALAAKPHVYLAAALCAERIAATKTGTATQRKVGDLSISYGGGAGGLSIADDYRALAKSLRRQAASKVTPYSGGISSGDKTTQEQDSDWDRPAFAVGHMDNPNTLSTSTRY